MARVRVSFARDLKTSLQEAVHRKIFPLTKDRGLIRSLAEEYGTAVAPFVPKSDDDTHRHMQEFYVEDNRVVWKRPALQDDELHGIVAGDDLADRLYYGPIRGRFQTRADGGNEYGEHQPRPAWDYAVRPGTDTWEKFIRNSAIIIMDWMDSNAANR